ncbi:MAG: ABC transporter permease [Dongiaceae bacterium]
MIVFVARRLTLMALTMLLASMVVFVICESTPGSVARKLLGPFATVEQVDLLAERLHLNDPTPVRYARWFGVLIGVVSDPAADASLGETYQDPRGDKYFGNLGYSTLYKEPVNDVIWERIGNSALLAGVAFLIVIPLALTLGVLSGIAPGSIRDRGISLISIVTSSIPEFASAVIFIAIFVVLLGWLPGTAPLETTNRWTIADQLILPIAVLVLYDFGYVTRIMRGSMAEVMAQPFVRTAILKGLPYRQVIVRHAMRNAMIAPFTVILLQIHFLITGVVVTEVIFAYPGFGRMLMDAALFGDIAIIEAATMIAVTIAVGTQFIGDIGYMLLNPRVRFK